MSAKKKRRRKRIAAIAAITSVLVVVAGMGMAYAAVSVPLPNIQAGKQTSFIYAADGHTEIARFQVENRQDVPLKKVPLDVQRAVISAEDRDFYENNGVSVRGTSRAVWGLVTGEDRGGGSTITQQ